MYKYQPSGAGGTRSPPSMRKVDDGGDKKKNERKKNNVVYSGLPEHQLTGTPHTRANFHRRKYTPGQEFGMEIYLDGRLPLMVEDLCWKTTFDGIQTLMEDNL